jgi:hypothetical protein
MKEIGHRPTITELRKEQSLALDHAGTYAKCAIRRARFEGITCKHEGSVTVTNVEECIYELTDMFTKSRPVDTLSRSLIRLLYFTVQLLL